MQYFSLRAGRHHPLPDAPECGLSRPLLSAGHSSSRRCTTPPACTPEWPVGRSGGASSEMGTRPRARAPPDERSRRSWARLWLVGWFSGTCCRTAVRREPLSYVLVARDGSLLGARIAEDGQWRFPALVPCRRSFAGRSIVFEDKRFVHHPASTGSPSRAPRSNLRAGRVVSGGSTLTMQLARLVARQASSAAVTWPRLARHCWRCASKCRYPSTRSWRCTPVMRLSAATWSASKRPHGATSAAHPCDLSWAEVATLAVLPNNPALVHLAAQSRNGSEPGVTSCCIACTQAGDSPIWICSWR